MFDSVADMLPGLLPASFRGIRFHVPDTSSEAGRRVVEYLFPGVDAASYDDFGRSPGVVSIDGLIIDDNYKAIGKALETAFSAPGPATLVHPWLGPMTVIMEEPGSISFSERELRVVRFTARFKRVQAGGGFIAGVSGLADVVASVVAVASALSAAVGTRVLSSARTQAVTRSTRIVTSTIAALTPPSGSRRFLPRLKTAIAGATPTTPATFDGLIKSTAALFGEATVAAAVSPAAEAIIEPAPSSQSLTSMGCAMTEQLTKAAIAAPADADRALLLAAGAHAIAQAAAQSSYVEYTSRREALAFRARATDALTGLSDGLDLIGNAFQAEATAARRALLDLQAALIADINEIVGRLPAVLVFRTDRDLDAWLLAAHVFGDTPARMEAGYRDIVSRNPTRHPSALPAGDIEVLG